MIKKAICIVSVAPIRADHSDKSEMTSQLLFGESVDVLLHQDNWCQIKMHFDGYEGWVDTKQILFVEEEVLCTRKTSVLAESFSSMTIGNEPYLLSIGSEVECKSEKKKPCTREQIIETALHFLNVPYLWGGRSFFAIDCSGFVQLVYKANGVVLPRDAYQQAETGVGLSFLEESQPGDLAFFENAEGIIIHVGIMLENHKIIHASGKVRIDAIDSTGIFNAEMNKHTHTLRIIKCIL